MLEQCFCYNSVFIFDKEYGRLVLSLFSPVIRSYTHSHCPAAQCLWLRAECTSLPTDVELSHVTRHSQAFKSTVSFGLVLFFYLQTGGNSYF